MAFTFRLFKPLDLLLKEHGTEHSHLMAFKRKIFSFIALTLVASGLYWSWVIAYLLTATINLHLIDSESAVSGQFRVMPSFTRGYGAWNRYFIDEIEVSCAPVGYNRCDANNQLPAVAGHPVEAKYIEYQSKPFRALNLVLELSSGSNSILSAEAQKAAFRSFNERSQYTNISVLVIATLAYAGALMLLIRRVFISTSKVDR